MECILTSKASHTPDFSVVLTPSASLLFRFSALTFNAHKIHLDLQYAHKVEGHRNLLVHGPLSLVLMLSVLRAQLKRDQVVTSFSYRNLAPLYADEEMKICLRNDINKPDKFEVWIEGKHGGFAVRGTATIGRMEAARS
jgi:hydroxyacyl-ACP dehydratase HTD2-like protein with hotdog domain